MARLNEAPVPAESHLEILRRKFLRQNRDIAKINSDQSQKIRRLENDCARLLSENLDLRSQILRLEKQCEDNNGRRIADHALEVKAKLEAQLSEFAALLGSLGEETSSKRHASEERILAKSRRSVARSPPQRRRRTTMDLDALAEQEGRLPPIYENKQYARATMNSAEIMALCAAAEDSNDSPDLGPPPVSRYVKEDPVKHDSPTRSFEEIIPESPRRPLTLSSPPKLDYDRKPSPSPEPKKTMVEPTIQQVSPSKDAAPAMKAAAEPTRQPVRAGAKRKFGDENGNIQSTTVQPGKENSVVTEKTFPARGGQKRRSLAELAGAKTDRRARTPLAAKSTNADVSSPRKMLKAAPPKGAKKEQARGLDTVMRDDAKTPKALPEIEVLAPEPSAVAVMLETATSLPSAAPSSPSTPGRQTQQEVPHDTPPPADISSTGEMTRPSRRVRASISYAEPNLRDKMRRPTKQLFDAVAGEGKFVHRSNKADDHHPAPTSSSKLKSEPGTSSTNASKILSLGDPTPKAQQQALLSPLAQKDVFSETLPSTVVTERRKRPSAVRESLAALERPVSTSPEPAHTTSVTISSATTDKQPPAPPPAPDADIYDFTASSPASSKHSTADTSDEFKPTTTTSSSSSSHTTTNAASRPRTTRKSSMAAAAALRELLDEEEEHDSKSHHHHHHQQTVRPPKPRSAHGGGGRKRASMLAPKKSSMLESLEEAAADADTSGTSAEGEVGREGRIARRRSMML